MAERRPGDARLPEFANKLYQHLRKGFSRRRNDGTGSMPPDSTRPRPLLHWLPRGFPHQGVEHLAELLLETRGQHFAAPEPGFDFAEQSAASPFAVQLYAQGFAVYALSTYALVFDAPGAATWARGLFLTLDDRRHDAEHGGYDQTKDGGWIPFAGAPAGAAKCTNSHIHLLEALTPLCKAFPGDEILCARLSELSRLIVTKLLQPQGYVHKFFAKDWEPIGQPEVSYGHDLETSWLLREALSVLKDTGKSSHELEEVVLQGCEKMAEHALLYGSDPAGGVFDTGVPAGCPGGPTVTGHDKVWWAQAEAMPGIYQLYRTRMSDELLERLEATFEFFSTKSWDSEGGEFFWGVDSEGKVAGRGDHKGEMWKTPYHGLRACLFTCDWIREDLGA